MHSRYKSVESLSKSFTQLLFHDDNQGMVGVVRSGRNPTMRHLERTMVFPLPPCMNIPKEIILY